MNRDDTCMTDSRQPTDNGQLYGFGATAPEALLVVRRRTASLLSILALALCAAVAVTIVAVMPIGEAVASGVIDPLLR